MKDSIIKNIAVNTRAFFLSNLRRNDNRNLQLISELEKKLFDYKLSTIMSYFSIAKEEAIQYKEEMDYLKEHGQYEVFPYRKSIYNTSTETGRCHGMSYVLHKGKRLFFQEGQNEEEASNILEHYLQCEHLIDLDDTYGKPHQYQSERIKVENGDILFDIGSAEGLFALENIEKASKVILVECDNAWTKPLLKTFEPFKNKVEIIEKKISDNNTGDFVSLTSLLTKYNGKSCYIKMDVEGAEYSAISSIDCSKLKYDKIKIAAATYHRNNDYQNIKQKLEEYKFRTESSSGYMLFDLYDVPEPPFFRHGIIRAIKEK